jgi:hypothetical protein
VTRAKFQIGDRVTYRDDRRVRRTIACCYWQPRDPGWRYLFIAPTPGVRVEIAARWAVMERALLLAPLDPTAQVFNSRGST